MTKLTLQEIAKIYRKHPTTFLRYVRSMQIPHIKLGGTMLFDPDEVETFLAQRTRSQEVAVSDISTKPVQRSQRRRSVPQSSRYADLLGLLE